MTAISKRSDRTPAGTPAWLPLALLGAVLSLFLLLPWPLEEKSLALLHGLCAQQPGHSLWFGEHRLPFDARMTGIYGGVAAGLVALVAAGRWRAGLIPPLRVLIALAGGVALLAADGLNSTARDLGYGTLWTPRNELRLATGLLTGTALATFLVLLTAQVGYRRSARRAAAPLASLRELGLLLIVQAAVGALALSGWAPVYLPLALLLVAAAIIAVSGLTLAFVLLLGRREARATSTGDLAGPATVALAVALAIVLALSGGRYLLEAWLGLEPALRGGA